MSRNKFSDVYIQMFDNEQMFISISYDGHISTLPLPLEKEKLIDGNTLTATYIIKRKYQLGSERPRDVAVFNISIGDIKVCLNYPYPLENFKTTPFYLHHTFAKTEQE